jgi:predicted transcriptional regulator
MSEIKNLSLRLSKEEYVAFDTICREKGYSKTGKIREFIRNLIREELESVKVSAEEWAKILDGIREIEKGEYVSFEELKNEFKKKKVDNRKNR